MVSRRAVLAGGGALGAAAVSGCIGAGGDRDVTETVEESYETGDVSELAIELDDGDVTVRGEEREGIDVTATKRAAGENHLDDVELAADRDDGRLALSVERESAIFRLGPEPTMDLTVAVPADLRVAEIDSENGQIEATDVTGDLRIDGTNGEITADAVAGSLTVDTTNGQVRASDVAGDVTADTTNGEVEIVDPGGDVTVDTTNGEVTVTGAAGDVTVDTTNGEVQVSVVDPGDTTLDLSTDNGTITVDGFDGDRIDGGSAVEQTFGEGTDRINVETTNGDIRVEASN